MPPDQLFDVPPVAPLPPKEVTMPVTIEVNLAAILRDHLADVEERARHLMEDHSGMGHDEAYAIAAHALIEERVVQVLPSPYGSAWIASSTVDEALHLSSGETLEAAIEGAQLVYPLCRVGD